MSSNRKSLSERNLEADKWACPPNCGTVYKFAREGKDLPKGFSKEAHDKYESITGKKSAHHATAQTRAQKEKKRLSRSNKKSDAYNSKFEEYKQARAGLKNQNLGPREYADQIKALAENFTNDLRSSGLRSSRGSFLKERSRNFEKQKPNSREEAKERAQNLEKPTSTEYKYQNQKFLDDYVLGLGEFGTGIFSRN